MKKFCSRKKSTRAMILAFISTLLACSISVSAQDRQQSAEIEFSPVIPCETADGHIVCAGGSYSQIPGSPDLFVGRGSGIAARMDECHHPKKLDSGSPVWRDFLALYRMDWKNNKMIFVNYLFKLPDRPAPGMTIHDNIHVAAAADPYVVSHRGKLWVAFEASVGMHGFNGNGSCIAPLSSDFKRLDLSKITLVTAPTKEKSASTPALMSFHDHLYIYWTNCNGPEHDRQPQYKLIARGMEIEEDGSGRMWGKGSNGHPVTTDNPHLTALVYDADRVDVTRDHTANLFCVQPFDDKIIVLASVGGSAGKATCCCSPHEPNAGCWRMLVSVAHSPLGPNAFGEHVLDLPSLPVNAVSYPRIAVDPSGHHVVFGSFYPPKKLGIDLDDTQYPAGFLTLHSGKSVKAGGGTLGMQNQGALEFQTAHGKPLWTSPRHEENTDDSFYATFQGDGNLAIYRGESPYWATGTSGHPDATLVVSNSEPYLSIVDKKRNQLLWPFHISHWPCESPPRPAIPHGERYIGFDAILKQALK